MLSLIYGSTATQTFSDADLVDLLKKAREKNARLDVTGCLLYHKGTFLQVLEGDETTINKLFDTISKDSRHHEVICFLKRKIQEREFGEWRMGFVNAQRGNGVTVDGYTNFLANPQQTKLDFVKQPSFAHEFMLAFRDNIR
jgi:hypothetical protein